MTNEERRQRVIELADARGDFVVVEDGDWVYWPDKLGGFTRAHELRWLAAELDRRNEKERRDDP